MSSAQVLLPKVQARAIPNGQVITYFGINHENFINFMLKIEQKKDRFFTNLPIIQLWVNYGKLWVNYGKLRITKLRLEIMGIFHYVVTVCQIIITGNYG